MLAFSLIVAVAAVLAVPTVLGAQALRKRRGVLEQRSQQARQAEQQLQEQRRARIFSRPADFIFRQATVLRARIQPLHNQLAEVEVDGARAKEALTTIAGPRHSGSAFYVPLATLALLVALIAIGCLLAVESFVALNDSVVAVTPVLKGIAATGVELAAGFGVTRVLHTGERRWDQVAWLTELATLLAIFVLSTGYVAVYSRQRSAQVYGPVVGLDERVLQAAISEHLPAAAVTAARGKLAADRSRMQRAELSDTALSIAIPVVELLTIGAAMSGLADLVAIRRRRDARRRHAAALRSATRLRGEIAATEVQATAETVTLLEEAGVTDLQRLFPNDRELPAGPRENTTPGPPAVSAPPNPSRPPASPAPAQPTDPRPPVARDSRLNLEGVEPAPKPDGNAAAAWDAASQI